MALVKNYTHPVVNMISDSHAYESFPMQRISRLNLFDLRLNHL